MILETVKIKCDRKPSGYVIINKSDFDPKLHELFVVEKKEVEGNEYRRPRRPRG